MLWLRTFDKHTGLEFLRFWAAPLQVLGSRFALTTSQHPVPDLLAEAEAYFQKVVEIARKQQAKSWELRASTSLARVWQQQGKKAEAHALLSEIYSRFTEGFDTKDSQEAKTVLEELA